MSLYDSFTPYASRLSMMMYSILALSIWLILGYIIYFVVSRVLARQRENGDRLENAYIRPKEQRLEKRGIRLD
jgi:hypothetical protein